MTDNEIITIDIEKYAKALNNLIGVDNAYLKGDKDVDAIVEIIVMAKKMEGIINRQKAELDDLREIVYMDRTDAIKNLKAEAIKEFAEKLKDIFVTIDGTFECWEVEEHIDNLVKEMTGENNG